MNLLSRRQSAPAADHRPDAAPLAARLGQLNAARKRVTEAIIEIEHHKTVPTPLADRKPALRRQHALELLASDAPIAEVEAMVDQAERLAHLLRLRIDIDMALELGNDRAQAMQAAEAGQRFASHKKEYDACMQKIVQAVLALEHSRQELDAFVRDTLKPQRGTPFEGQDWLLAGRLKHRISQTYRFTQFAVDRGWLSAAELQTELEKARKS